MTKQAQNGQQAEKMAYEYLTAKGYRLQVQGYRYKRGEADLIMVKNNLLVVVEVKMRSGHAFGYPESFVTEAQANRLHALATHYMQRIGWQGLLRFDVVAIERTRAGFEILHIEDAF